MSELRSQEFGFRLCRNIPEALRCGGSRIAVDAVLAIAEQGGDYPYSSNDMGQILLPTYDWFQQCAHVFEEENHAVPYFNHKQLSFSFPEAQNMVKTAERMKFPLLAGSSMPVTWRLPDVDIPMGAPVEEAVMVGVGRFDGMDFDALDAMQCMLERRKGGETGVKAVQLLEGDDVWAARKVGRWSEDLMSSALSRSDTPLGLTVLDGRTQDLAAARRFAAIGKRSGCVLHRVQRWDARHTAHAQRGDQRFQHLSAGKGPRHGFNPVLHAAGAKPDLLGLPGSEDRADVSDRERALSSTAHVADYRPAGGVPDFKASIESAVGDAAVGDDIITRPPNHNTLAPEERNHCRAEHFGAWKIIVPTKVLHTAHSAGKVPSAFDRANMVASAC